MRKNRQTIFCDWCGKQIERYPSQIKAKNFCCRQCLADYSNKAKNPDGYISLKDYTKMGEHLSELNRILNPIRMTLETRKKLRNARIGTGEGVAYAKYLGAHEHRIVAERILGRPLKKGEIVHHVDGDKRNNNPENIQVFPSQTEHARYHAKLAAFFRREGGDAR